MDFNDLLQSDVERTFTNPHEFGEVVSYQPQAGPARSVQALVTESRRQEYRGNEFVSITELRVLCGRDASADVGGIDAPRVGEVIRRTAARDPLGRAFGFTGDAQEAGPGSWTLLFEYTGVEQVGVSQIQQ